MIQINLYIISQCNCFKINDFLGCLLTGGVPGISIHKYRTLLNKDNSPFVISSSSGPVRRLWNYLVRQDEAQDVFIKAVFGKKMEAPIAHDTQLHDYTDNGNINCFNVCIKQIKILVQQDSCVTYS